MKRILLFFLIFLLCTSIAGCGQKPTVYEKNGYTVDLDAGTITKDGDVYAFTVTGRGDRSRIEITYPNGANYYFQWDGNSGHGGWSDDYDPERYADGDILMDLIDFDSPVEKRGGNPILGLVLIVIGLADAISPNTAWYLSYGWRFKNAEPSEAALVFGRIFGIFCVILGLILLFTSIFNAA